MKKIEKCFKNIFLGIRGYSYFEIPVFEVVSINCIWLIFHEHDFGMVNWLAGLYYCKLNADKSFI